MENWRLFEKQSVSYLNKIFSDSDFNFIHEGGSNSEAPDIGVKNRVGKNLFNIEAKLSPSQSGQFVIKESSGKYNLTKLSKLSNPFSQEIIDYLNMKSNDYLGFTSGVKEVNCDINLLINWVKSHYSSKHVFFIITSDSLDSFKSIIQMDELEKYFKVTACVRRKKSGTSHLPKSLFTFGLNKVKIHLKSINEQFISFTNENKKTIVEIKNTKDVIKKSDRYFGENLFLSPEDKMGQYSVKRTSSTNNINVIFSLIYIGERENMGEDKLKKSLMSVNK